jgi:hypothetical protein
MRALVYGLLLLLAMGSAQAQADSKLWHWYYISPPYSTSVKPPFLRFGTARVTIGEGKVRVDFTELLFPEQKPTFEGRVAKDGTVEGELNHLFFQGPELWRGHYRGTNFEKEGCRYEEIMLQTGYSDGIVLMVSRVQGKCREEDPDPLD